MKNNYIIVLSFFLIFACSQSNSVTPEAKVISNLKDEVDYLHYEKDVLRAYRVKEWKSAFTHLNNISLESVEGERKKLKDILKKDFTFIFYYGTSCCMTCVDEYLKTCNFIFDKINDTTSIYIISNYNSIREMKTKLIGMDLKPKFYITEDHLEIPMNDTTRAENPFMFVIDKKMTVYFPRIGVTPDSSSNPYFNRLIEVLSNDS